MKLAFLAPEFLPTWGGVGTYSVELLRNLCTMRDVEVHVLTPKRGPRYDKRKISRFFDDRLTIHNLSHANDGFFYNFTFQLGVLKHFNRLYKKHKFDLVHAANLVHMPDIYLKFQKRSVPSVTTIHTTIDSQSRYYHPNGHRTKSAVELMTNFSYPCIKLLENLYMKRTDNFIAVSQWIRNFIGSSHTTLDVVHNGIDTKRFSPKNRTAETFASLKESNQPIILYSGRLLALKGLPTLLYSMREVLKKVDAHFVFAGSGNVQLWEKRLSGISKKNYTFLNYVPYENIHKLTAQADLFVLPSYTESFPLTILEAMASEVPVVASNVGGIPEMIEHEKNGVLVTPGSSSELAVALIGLLQDNRMRKRIARAGRKHVKKNFTAKTMAQRTKKVYERIL